MNPMEISRLPDRGAVAGQVRPEQLAELAASGFVGIVNNRPDGEAPDQPSSDELEAEARRQGLSYWHIPVVPGEMTAENVRSFAGLLETVDGPLLAFCRTGTRSANLFKAAQALR
jgi:sulfide:quinone oxidoreductase